MDCHAANAVRNDGERMISTHKLARLMLNDGGDGLYAFMLAMTK
jgi:hypothetical protein